MVREVRRSVLLLARSFPPAENIGAVRARSIAAQLARRGWHVRVVTVEPNLLEQSNEGQLSSLIEAGVELCWTGHHLRFLLPGFLKSETWAKQRYVSGSLRRFARLFKLDSGLGWIAPALRACRELKAGDIDLVLATAPPYASFALAYVLSQRLRCPYVLDYRDSWTVSPHSEGPLQGWTRSLERRILSNAGGVIAISTSMATAMTVEFGRAGIEVLTNGYDSDSFEGVVPQQFDHPALIYAGSFYPPKRVISPMMEAIRLLPVNAVPVKLHYFGSDATHVIEEARRIGVEQRVVMHGKVPREQVLSAIKGASLAVVITSIDERGTLWDDGVVTGKLFEPIGLRVPVLLIAPTGSDARGIVKHAGAGGCFIGSDTRGIADFITNVTMSRKSFPFSGADRYSWFRLGDELHRVLERSLETDRGIHRA